MSEPTFPERVSRIEEAIADARAALDGMRLDCTREMRPDEISEAEGRRTVALGYLDVAAAAMDKVAWDTVVPRGMPRRGS